MKMTNRLIPTVTTVLTLAITSLASAQAVDNNQDTKDSRSLQKAYRSQDAQSPDLGTTSKPQKINKASELIGMKVQNPQGEDLGTIKDIVIDLNQGKVAYAVMDAGGGLLGLGEKLVAVPVYILQGAGDADYLTMNASKEKLKAAKGFDSSTYPALQESAWGAQPFWENDGSAHPDQWPADKTQPDAGQLPGQHRDSDRDQLNPQTPPPTNPNP